MRAALILVLLAGCGESDPCASFAGQTCIALRVNGTVAVDQLGITGTGVFSEKRTPGVRRATPLALPIAVAVLPGDVDAVTLQVRGYQLDVAVGEGTTNVILDRGRLTRAEVTLIGTGVDLAGVDVAGVDLATPPRNDLAAPGGAPLFPANQGLNGGGISAVLADFAMGGVWVGTVGAGVFRSDDAGRSWRAVNDGLKERNVDVLTASPVGAGYFAAVHDNSRNVLYRSQDGLRWTKQADLPKQARAIEFVGAFTMIIGFDSGGGLLRSMDSGVTLEPINNGFGGSPSISALVADPLASGTVYAGASGFVHKTVDAGDNWALANSGLSGVNVVRKLAFDPASRDLIAATNLGLFVLPLGMTSWQAFMPALPSNANASSSVFAQQSMRDFYASSGLGVFHLGGSDTIWRDVSAGTTVRGDFGHLEMDRSDPRLVYLSSGHHGLFVTSNSAGAWERRVDGIRNLPIASLAVDPKNPEVIFAGSSHDGIYRSTDGGASWTRLTNGIGANESVVAIAIHPTQTVVWAGTVDGDAFNMVSAFIYRSGDGGATWQVVDNSGATALAVDKNGVVYATGSGANVRKSVDGTTFVAASTGLPGIVSTITVDPTDPNVLYSGGGIFKSVDGAASWQAISSTVLSGQVYSFVVDPTDSNVVYASTPDNVFKSTSAGAAWALASNGLDGGFWKRVRVAADGKTLYAAGIKGLFKSSDAAASWTLLSSDFGLDDTQDMALHPTSPEVAWFGVLRGPGVLKTVSGGK